METIVYPDAVRGIISLVGEAAEEIGVRPQLIVTDDYADYNLDPIAHVQQVNSTVGDVDRVQEVRITVYGHQPLASQDAAEKILSYITGEGITTPAKPESSGGASDGAAAFYFDSIEQRVGPSMMEWPTDQVFPASVTLDVRARPMTE